MTVNIERESRHCQFENGGCLVGSRRHTVSWFIFVSLNLCLFLSPVAAGVCPRLLSPLECQDEWSIGLAVSDGFAYVTTFDPISEESGLKVVDVRSSLLPAEVGYLLLDPLDFCLGKPVVSGRYAYVNCSGSGEWSAIRIIDVSDPTLPFEVGVISQLGSIREVINGYAYTLTPSRVRVLDITDPASPFELGAQGLDYQHSFDELAVSGDHIYVTIVQSPYPNSTLVIIDASDPTELKWVGEVGLSSRKTGALAVSGDFAYVVDPGSSEDEISVIDVSDPSDPVVVASFQAGGTASVVAAGRLVFTTGDGDSPSSGVQVFDVSEPTAVVQLGSWFSVGEWLHFFDSTLHGSRLYVAAQGGECGLVVFDTLGCAKPYEPFPLSQSAVE